MYMYIYIYIYILAQKAKDSHNSLSHVKKLELLFVSVREHDTGPT